MKSQEVAPWVWPRAGLSSLADKLTTQPCKIAYLGASVTAQQAGYRPLLHQWFIEQSGQAHEAIHAAIGGIGSAAGVFLMDDLVVRRKPHLCLIEFTTGDVSSGTPLPLVGPAIEGMVRKLHQIDCA